MSISLRKGEIDLNSIVNKKGPMAMHPDKKNNKQLNLYLSRRFNSLDKTNRELIKNNKSNIFPIEGFSIPERWGKFLKEVVA